MEIADAEETQTGFACPIQPLLRFPIGVITIYQYWNMRILDKGYDIKVSINI